MYEVNPLTMTLDTIQCVNYVPMGVVTATISVPWDLKVYDNRLYVLLDTFQDGLIGSGVPYGLPAAPTYGNNRYNHRIEVYSTTDLENWTCHFSEKCQTFGRSFAFYDGFCYIGLGGHYLNNSVRTGEIWKVKL